MNRRWPPGPGRQCGDRRPGHRLAPHGRRMPIGRPPKNVRIGPHRGGGGIGQQAPETFRHRHPGARPVSCAAVPCASTQAMPVLVHTSKAPEVPPSIARDTTGVTAPNTASSKASQIHRALRSTARGVCKGMGRVGCTDRTACREAVGSHSRAACALPCRGRFVLHQPHQKYLQWPTALGIVSTIDG